MGVFKTLMSKIFGTQGTSAPAVATNTSPAPPTPSTPGTPSASTAASANPATPTPQTVDIEAVMEDLAAKNPEKLDWKKSIVDLMKLVGIDSSLASRKDLAKELDYSGDMNDSASMNIWLHKEVLRKLSANGGKVPAELLD